MSNNSGTLSMVCTCPNSGTISNPVTINSVTTSICCPPNSTFSATAQKCLCNANYYVASTDPTLPFACIASCPTNSMLLNNVCGCIRGYVATVSSTGVMACICDQTNIFNQRYLITYNSL